MADIIEKLAEIPQLYHAQGCTDSQIADAEQTLGITFPEEFKTYVKTYGAISFYATEWTGLNVGSFINVVNATKQEREFNADFPKDCFVLENQAIDGILTVMDGAGKIYLVQYDKKEYLCDSLDEYLDICLKRNSK